MTDPAVNDFCEAALLIGRDRAVRDHAHLDALQVELNHLRAADRRDGAVLIEAAEWPLAFAARQNEHVAAAAEHALQSRQTATAGAGFAGFGEVAEVVAQERHREV